MRASALTAATGVASFSASSLSGGSAHRREAQGASASSEGGPNLYTGTGSSGSAKGSIFTTTSSVSVAASSSCTLPARCLRRRRRLTCAGVSARTPGAAVLTAGAQGAAAPKSADATAAPRQATVRRGACSEIASATTARRAARRRARSAEARSPWALQWRRRTREY